MKVYIVRIAESHTPVGVFWAASMEDLATKVDSCLDPQETEYAVLPEGEGISLEGEAPEGSANPWAQRIRKWTQLEGMDPVRLHWKPLKTYAQYRFG